MNVAWLEYGVLALAYGFSTLGLARQGWGEPARRPPRSGRVLPFPAHGSRPSGCRRVERSG